MCLPTYALYGRKEMGAYDGMNADLRIAKKSDDPDTTTYSAPALEKGLDILELLCRSETPLSQKDIAHNLGRSVSEIYRMVTCLVERDYLVDVDENFHVTTKLFELAHVNTPTHRLLYEAMPLMQKLSSELDQSCHLTVYNQGRQVVVSKVDAPSGMGFSVRVGAELDVIISASGRVLLAFQDKETRSMRVAETIRRRPDHADPQIETILDAVRMRGFQSIHSVQVRGLYAVVARSGFSGARNRGADSALCRTHRSGSPQVHCGGRRIIGYHGARLICAHGCPSCWLDDFHSCDARCTEHYKDVTARLSGCSARHVRFGS